jgi:peptidylprolyl isomerase
MFKFSSSSASSIPRSLNQLTTTTLRPSITRQFHASTSKMVVNAYFDVTWTGPEYQTDASGKVTSKDNEAKRESPPSSTPH